jgi:hypothetical protein
MPSPPGTKKFYLAYVEVQILFAVLPFINFSHTLWKEKIVNEVKYKFIWFLGPSVYIFTVFITIHRTKYRTGLIC